MSDELVNGNDKDTKVSDSALERGQWSGRFDFLMSMIAYAVGLGTAFLYVTRKLHSSSAVFEYSDDLSILTNILLILLFVTVLSNKLNFRQHMAFSLSVLQEWWRKFCHFVSQHMYFRCTDIDDYKLFTKKCALVFKGAFLVVYGIFFSVAAVPIFVMEVTIGQYLQSGSMEIWRMCPIFTGVGIGNVVISFMCISYFCIIISWSIFYMISSIAVTFPWETCDNWWNNRSTCLTGSENISVVEEIMHKLNGTVRTETSVEQYWERRVLMQSDSIAEFKGIQWELLILTLLSWTLVYFALWKGITKARKFVYFCAIFPYFLLIILLIRGLTLPGAYEGIRFYITPNITVLSEATVWKDAGTQVFYSYGLGFGTLIALGSHNIFHHNCFRDALIMCFINGSTSILAGFAVFSVLGYMSYRTLKPIDQIVKGGVGLAFQAYPEVATMLPGKQFWSVLFFLMITIIGLDSQVCMLEGLFTALEDVYPSILRKHKKLSLLLICLLFFIIGIPMVSHAGSYWLTLFDGYGASGIALLFVVIFETIGLAWGFGANNIRNALYVMAGRKLSKIWNLVWQYFAPAVTTLLLFFCVWQHTPEKAMNGEEYPYWAQLFGFFLALCSTGAIPFYAIYHMWTVKEGASTKLLQGLHPHPSCRRKGMPNSYENEEEMTTVNT